MSDPRFDVAPSVSNHFAWIRTQLGLQRTLMAAVRTSVSLIGFGFTVSQFFQRMQGVEGLREMGGDLPRNLGLVLIVAGVVSLVVFTWQYHQSSAYLRGPEFESIGGGKKRPLQSSTYFVSFVVMLIGVAAFVSVFLHF